MPCISGNRLARFISLKLFSPLCPWQPKIWNYHGVSPGLLAVFFLVVRPLVIWPWEGSNYPFRSCNGLHGPKEPKFKKQKQQNNGGSKNEVFYPFHFGVYWMRLDERIPKLVWALKSENIWLYFCLKTVKNWQDMVFCQFLTFFCQKWGQTLSDFNSEIRFGIPSSMRIF